MKMVRLSILLLFLGSAFAAAAPPASGEPGVAIARLRALNELEWTLRTLPLGDGLTVGAWAARDARRDAGLRAWLRARPPWRIRKYSNGVIEVDVLADPLRLARWMIAQPAVLLDDQAPDPLARRIHAAADGWPLVWAAGAAGPEESPNSEAPPGWEDVRPSGIDAARQAATAAVRTELLSGALRIRVAPGRLLADALGDSEALRARLIEQLQAAVQIESQLLPEQLARVRGTLDFDAVSRIAVALLIESGRTREQAASDLRELVLSGPRAGLTAEALVPPPLTHTLVLPQALVAWDPGAPEWIRKQWRVTAPVSEGWPPGWETLALDRAWLAALARLRAPLFTLEIAPGWTIADLIHDPHSPLAARDALAADLETLLGSARLMTPLAAGRRLPPRIEVEWPLANVWRVVRSHVDPAALPAREPPAAEPPPEAPPDPQPDPAVAGDGESGGAVPIAEPEPAPEPAAESQPSDASPSSGPGSEPELG